MIIIHDETNGEIRKLISRKVTSSSELTTPPKVLTIELKNPDAANPNTFFNVGLEKGKKDAIIVIGDSACLGV